MSPRCGYPVGLGAIRVRIVLSVILIKVTSVDYSSKITYTQYMASLQKVTSLSRHILVIGTLFIVGLFILITIINIIKSLNPPPPPAPTVSFGKLSPISFPQNITTKKIQYSVDTLSGNFPDFGNQAKVYKIQVNQPTLNALDNAILLVSKMGYTGTPIKVSDTDYQWTNTDDLPKTLLMNIFTNNFAIASAYQSNPDVLQSNNLPDQNGAISLVNSYLQNSSLMPTDIDSNKTKATLLTLANGQLSAATSFSNTQIVEVDLFQNDVNGLPVFYPQPTHSTISFFVGGGGVNPQIVLANFNHQTVASDNATYPIYTSQQAFDMLKNGQAYIASYDGTSTSIVIHNIVLGYYMSDVTQQYLQPIIVLEGDNGFFAYVPAIKSEWINKSN